MSNCGKAFSEWAGIQGLTSQRLRPRRRKQNTAIQTEALEDRVMLSAVLGSVDTQAVDLGGNLPTFSEFDASESGMATVDTSGHEEVANSQKNGWIIAGNPSLQEQPGADGFWVAPSPESAAVVELSNQIDADSGDNMNQLGDVKGEATDKDHFVGPEGIKGEATDKDHKWFNPQSQPPGNDWISIKSHPGDPSIVAEGEESLIGDLDYPEESKDGWKFGLPGGGEVISDRS